MPQKKIDGLEFEITLLPAWEAVEILARGTQLIGPMVPGLMKLSTDDKLEASSIAPLLLITAEKIDVKEVVAMAKRLLAGAMVKGTVANNAKYAPLEEVFDTLMRGKMMTLFRLIGWAAQENFGDFFGSMRKDRPPKQQPPKGGEFPTGPDSPQS